MHVNDPNLYGKLCSLNSGSTQFAADFVPMNKHDERFIQGMFPGAATGGYSMTGSGATGRAQRRLLEDQPGVMVWPDDESEEDVASRKRMLRRSLLTPAAGTDWNPSEDEIQQTLGSKLHGLTQGQLEKLAMRDPRFRSALEGQQLTRKERSQLFERLMKEAPYKPDEDENEDYAALTAFLQRHAQ